MDKIWSAIDSFVGNTQNASLMEARPCPICGSSSSREIFTIDDFQYFTDSSTHSKRANLSQHQCAHCFTVFMNPGYSARGFQVLFAEAGCSYGASAARPAAQVEWLQRQNLLVSNGSVLDVGCFQGKFLSLMPDGIKKIGVDIDDAVIARGRAEHGKRIELYACDFEKFQYDSKVDTITMYHVLEHLARPVAVLRQLLSLAKPTTRLVVEVPILEKGVTNDIVGFISAQHMTHFSRNSLHNALICGGWEPLDWVEENYNGCRVVAKPASENSSVSGDRADVSKLWQVLSARNQAAEAVSSKLASVPVFENCVIWGAGMHTEYLYQSSSLFRRHSGPRWCLVDTDRAKQGKSWRGITIFSPEILGHIEWPTTWLLVSSYGSQEGIASAAAELGVPKDRIIKLYDYVRVY